MDWTKFGRNAVPGESVYFYPRGTNSEPMLAIATEASGVCVTLALMKPMSARHECRRTVRHVNDPHFKKHPERLAQDGAWDFHPVFGPIVSRQVQSLKANEASRQKLSEDREQMERSEIEALEAMESLGPNLSKITQDTGLSSAKLKELPRFMEEYHRQKQQERERISREAKEERARHDAEREAKKNAPKKKATKKPETVNA